MVLSAHRPADLSPFGIIFSWDRDEAQRAQAHLDRDRKIRGGLKEESE